MRPKAILFAVFACAGTAALSFGAAGWAVRAFEQAETARLVAHLDDEGLAWPAILVDGQRVTLSGAAPDEPERFRAIERLSALVPARHLTDRTTLATDPEAVAPSFYLQVLRRGTEATLIGLVPTDRATDAFRKRLGTQTPDGIKTTLLATVKGPAPEGWSSALDLALRAVSSLDPARIDLTPGAVRVGGMAASGTALTALEAELQGNAGAGLDLDLDLTAPLPVRTPYVFRMTHGPDRTRVSHCAAETPRGRGAILAAIDGGSAGAVRCDLALGAPTPDWPVAVAAGIAGLRALDGGMLEVVNTALKLTSRVGADPLRFEAAAGRIEAALPAPYTLLATLQPRISEATPEIDAPPMEFIALRTDNGVVEVRGDLRDAGMQRTAASFAKAQFGFDAVADQTRLRADLPPLWYTRVLVGLEALSMLSTGQVTVTPTDVTVTGAVEAEATRTELAALLERKMPEPRGAVIDVVIDPRVPEPEVSAVRAEFCAVQIETVLARNQILFPPGETDISPDSLAVVDAIAAILADCPGARFEIEGHTDAQGRESSNLAISEARAGAVLSALLDRGIDLIFLSSKGYGESRPVAPNDTEAGRALNRRITFQLLRDPKPEDAPILAAANAPADPGLDPAEGGQPVETAETAEADTTLSAGAGQTAISPNAEEPAAYAPASAGDTIVAAPDAGQDPAGGREASTTVAGDDPDPTETAETASADGATPRGIDTEDASAAGADIAALAETGQTPQRPADAAAEAEGPPVGEDAEGGALASAAAVPDQPDPPPAGDAALANAEGRQEDSVTSASAPPDDSAVAAVEPEDAGAAGATALNDADADPLAPLRDAVAPGADTRTAALDADADRRGPLPRAAGIAAATRSITSPAPEDVLEPDLDGPVALDAAATEALEAVAALSPPQPQSGEGVLAPSPLALSLTGRPRARPGDLAAEDP